MATNKYEHLKTGAGEYIKSYITYDFSDRMSVVYEARANALNGEPCLKTTYTYVIGTTRVEKMKEEETTWSSAYDI
jgi:hypothetical protein